MEYCGHCGSEQDSGATFCGSCGESLDTTQECKIESGNITVTENYGVIQKIPESKTVHRIGIWSATKVTTVLYALIMIPISLLVGVGMLISGSDSEAFGIMIGLPVVYIAGAFIFSLIGTWLLNIALGWTGGIEVDVG